jgi:hypothetical protein
MDHMNQDSIAIAYDLLGNPVELYFTPADYQ